MLTVGMQAVHDTRVNFLLGFGVQILVDGQALDGARIYTNDNELDPDSASADPILLFHRTYPRPRMRFK